MDVAEAREEEVFEQLAADAAGADKEDSRLGGQVRINRSTKQ